LGEVQKVVYTVETQAILLTDIQNLWEEFNKESVKTGNPKDSLKTAAQSLDERPAVK
jgi:hypothetical protein